MQSVNQRQVMRKGEIDVAIHSRSSSSSSGCNGSHSSRASLSDTLRH